MATVTKRIWQKASGEEETAWVVRYADQNKKWHLKTFARKKDADAYRVTTEGEVRRGVHTPERDSITVQEAAKIWLDARELNRRERSTLKQYRNHVALHIEPLIGPLKLAHLSSPRVETFRDELLRKGSPVMARKVLTSLKGILGEALRRGLVAHNAAATVKVEIDKRQKGHLVIGRDVPSLEEIQTIITQAEGRWRPLLVTAVFTGMRASELRGLTWNDVDFKKKTMHVRQRANLWGEIGAPKSLAGHREIPMSPLVVNTLKAWKLACPKGPANLVFPNGNGRVENHANIANRGFYALQIAAGIVDGKGRPKYGLHALRHFFASWAIQQGFSPKRVQVLLGHSSIQITFDVYGHLFPNPEDDHAKFAAGELTVTG